MRKTLRITAVLCFMCMGALAKGDAPLVYCTGTESGGSGPRQYAYEVDSASYPMIEFRVGTNDLDPDHYDRVLGPPGWNFALEPMTMGHIRGLKTPHGEVSPGPCRCLTEGSVHWWTDDPALAVEYFVFGYDHPWPSEDVGWDLNTRREGFPPESYSFSEFWDAQTGTGMGPVHGPCAPAEECQSNADCELDDYCRLPPGTCDAPGTSRPRPHGCPAGWDLVCGCDGVTYANDCQAAAVGVSVAYGSACLPGDFDRDGDADLADFSVLAACMTGPGGGIPLDCDVADLDGDDDVDLRDLHIFHNASSPRVGKYSDSGCLPGTDHPPLDGYPQCGEDQIELTVGPGTLHVLHRNATYNCCVDDIAISISVEGAVLRLTEEEFLANGGCYCLCCYDVEAAVVDLSPGAYTVELCWQDWESQGMQCHAEDIVIPEPQPRIEGYSNSGCLSDYGRDESGEYPWCGEELIELTAGPGRLHVLHSSATYNCCPDDIVISMSVEGTTLRLEEQEVLTMPCFCLCCYNVEATVADLAPGTYTVEFCWYDYETDGEQCYMEDVEIPQQVETVESDRPREMLPVVEPGELEELVAGNSAFAFDFYRAVAGEEGNLFYSPYSVSAALAMTYAGARGETEQQMGDTLHFTLGQERLHTAFNALDLELARRGEGAAGQDGEGFRLNIVNAIWGQTGYPFVPDFLDLLAVNYGAGLRLLDFYREPEACRIVINDWVSDQTEGRIEDLISPGAITWLTRLVLTNAIYFNAAWKFPFVEDDTRDGTFDLLDGGQVTVPMMFQIQKFGYAQGDGYQAVELLYDGDELSMVVLLPGAGGFGEFERSVDAQRLVEILSDVEPTDVALAMPKFTYESSFSLKDTFPAMGMSNAFIPGVADFSGINGTRTLYIFDVLHKAFVSVDEAGTEAAAATAVILGETALPPQPVVVTVNRPFIFVIRDIATGAILFVGRVLDPST